MVVLHAAFGTLWQALTGFHLCMWPTISSLVMPTTHLYHATQTANGPATFGVLVFCFDWN